MAPAESVDDTSETVNEDVPAVVMLSEPAAMVTDDIESKQELTVGMTRPSPDAAVICADDPNTDTKDAVPEPKKRADEPPATEITELVRLIVVEVRAPPTEMPVLELYVTIQLAELNVMPTDETAPPNCKQEPEVITVLPERDIVDEDIEIAADDIARNAPV